MEVLILLVGAGVVIWWSTRRHSDSSRGGVGGWEAQKEAANRTALAQVEKLCREFADSAKASGAEPRILGTVVDGDTRRDMYLWFVYVRGGVHGWDIGADGYPYEFGRTGDDGRYEKVYRRLSADEAHRWFPYTDGESRSPQDLVKTAMAENLAERRRRQADDQRRAARNRKLSPQLEAGSITPRVLDQFIEVMGGPQARASSRPPIHARFEDGVNGNVLLREIASLLDRGRVLRAGVATGDSDLDDVDEWGETVRERVLVLFVPNVVDGLMPLSFPDFDSMYGLSRRGICQGLLAYGLNYLEELQERMPEYMEASGQAPAAPQVSVTINGGTVVNPQIAARIDIIESTISAVVQQGDNRIAEALSALERAVLAEQAVDQATRSDLLDGLQALADAARTHPEKRNRGVVKAILSTFKTAAASGPELAKAVAAWGTLLGPLAS